MHVQKDFLSCLSDPRCHHCCHNASKLPYGFCTWRPHSATPQALNVGHIPRAVSASSSACFRVGFHSSHSRNSTGAATDNTEISPLLHYYLKAAPWANLQAKAGTPPVLWVPAAPTPLAHQEVLTWCCLGFSRTQCLGFFPCSSAAPIST